MTYQELLLSVDFRKVADAYCKMYPEQAHMLPFLKCHYDMLCNTAPVFDPDANSQVCHISMECDEGTKKRYLSAFPMEGDLWSASLCKTLEIDPDVTASPEEIAACCLWHTSFYGYTEEQLASTAEGFSTEWRDKNDLEKYKLKLTHNLSTIERLYNYTPTLPSFNTLKNTAKKNANIRYEKYRQKHIRKHLKNRWFRREFIPAEYYRYLYGISQFILDVKTSSESIQDLCQLYCYKKFIAYNYRSYTYGKSDPAEYLYELIERYNALDTTFANAHICLVRSIEIPTDVVDIRASLSPAEKKLCRAIMASCNDMGSIHITSKYDHTLKNEMRIIIGFYEF